MPDGRGDRGSLRNLGTRECRTSGTPWFGYGDPQSPVAAPLKHDLHLNMMISTS
jgi:hypothetical protein